MLKPSIAAALRADLACWLGISRSGVVTFTRVTDTVSGVVTGVYVGDAANAPLSASMTLCAAGAPAQWRRRAAAASDSVEPDSEAARRADSAAAIAEPAVAEAVARAGRRAQAVGASPVGCVVSVQLQIIGPALPSTGESTAATFAAAQLAAQINEARAVLAELLAAVAPLDFYGVAAPVPALESAIARFAAVAAAAAPPLAAASVLVAVAGAPAYNVTGQGQLPPGYVWPGTTASAAASPANNVVNNNNDSALGNSGTEAGVIIAIIVFALLLLLCCYFCWFFVNEPRREDRVANDTFVVQVVKPGERPSFMPSVRKIHGGRMARTGVEAAPSSAMAADPSRASSMRVGPSEGDGELVEYRGRVARAAAPPLSPGAPHRSHHHHHHAAAPSSVDDVDLDPDGFYHGDGGVRDVPFDEMFRDSAAERKARANPIGSFKSRVNPLAAANLQAAPFVISNPLATAGAGRGGSSVGGSSSVGADGSRGAGSLSQSISGAFFGGGAARGARPTSLSNVGGSQRPGSASATRAGPSRGASVIASRRPADDSRRDDDDDDDDDDDSDDDNVGAARAHGKPRLERDVGYSRSRLSEPGTPVNKPTGVVAARRQAAAARPPRAPGAPSVPAGAAAAGAGNRGFAASAAAGVRRTGGESSAVSVGSSFSVASTASASGASTPTAARAAAAAAALRPDGGVGSLAHAAAAAGVAAVASGRSGRLTPGGHQLVSMSALAAGAGAPGTAASSL